MLLTKAFMPDSESQEPEPVSPKPEEDAPPERRVADAPERPKTFFAEFATIFSTYKWPGWGAILLAAFLYIPDWQGRAVFWIDTLRAVGGTAEKLAGFLPYAPSILVIFGGTYVIISTLQEELGRARQWLPLAGWTVLLVFVTVFSSLALFVNFVTTSNIPAAMEYFAEKSADRYMTIEQAENLKAELQKVKADIPEFSIAAQRDTETLQYARLLLKVLKEGGLKIKIGGQEQDVPEARDFYSTSQRGIMIGTKYSDAPTRSAILLKQIFERNGLKPTYVTLSTDRADALMILVGPK